MTRIELDPNHLATIRHALNLRRRELCRLIHKEQPPFRRVPADELDAVVRALRAVNRAMQPTPNADRLLGGIE